MRVASVVVVLVGIAAGGCSYHSYTPPARMMPLETAVGPARGAADVQLEGSTASSDEIFGGFSATSGAARLRGGITDNVSVSGEGGVISVGGETDTPIDRNAYVGRIAAHVHEADRGPGAHVAFTAGLGGGTSSVAGSWLSEDAAVIVSGNGRWFVPFASLDGFASQPVHATQFAYVDVPDGATHVDELARTAGFRVTTGFELRNGDGANSSFGVIVGLMLGGIYRASYSDGFGGLGIGFRLAL